MNDEFKAIEERYLRIKENVERARSSGQDVRIMAVTKTVAPERINHAISLGIDLIGENRVQEYLSKKDAYLPAETHMIGHLQSNKIKYIIDDVSMIQSVDSIRLAQEISRQAMSRGKVMDILCEVNIGGEESKSGFTPEDISEATDEISELGGIRLRGLMTIPPAEGSSAYFERMRRVFDDLRGAGGEFFDTLSMGMSADHEEAVRCGSTLVRIGSGLFGARVYR